MKTLLPLTLVALMATGCSQETHTATKKNISNIYTKNTTSSAFKQSMNLNQDDEDKHMLGRSFFTIPWAQAPAATTARDGLGPLYSANTCIHCHPKNGAGIPMQKEEISRSLVMRLSINNIRNINNNLILKTGFIPEPTYGGQLSLHSSTKVPYEGKIKIYYENIDGVYEDKSTYTLQKPSYKLTNLQYGKLHPNTNIAGHIGLALIGLGAIERIDEKVILAKEDIDDRDNDGISGKANWVYNPETNTTQLGRFTWKAAAASVKQQVSNAAHNDMSLSNPLYPEDNCTEKQVECLEATKGLGEFDLPMRRVNAIAFYLKTLKIPMQRMTKHFKEGEKIFNSIGCVKCHTSSFTLADTNTIQPYSDFLLHDMGDELSDGHTMFKAEANEFRTPPLWGMGLYKKVSKKIALLHDGRARSIEEAILWHGGEAKEQQKVFKSLSKEKREFLLSFLKGI